MADVDDQDRVGPTGLEARRAAFRDSEGPVHRRTLAPEN